MRLDPSMKLALAVLVTAACHHEVPAPLAPADPATLITPDVAGIMRSSAADSPILQYAHQLVASDCAQAIVGKLGEAYQLDVTGHNIFLFQGDVRPEEVQSCLAKSSDLKVSRDGERLVIELLGKRAYVGWRGDVMVAGTQAQVTAALAQHDDALARTWRARIAALPPGKLAMWTQRPMFSAFLGVPTHGGTLSADITGPRQYAIRFDIECADPAAAEAARAQLATGQVPPGIEPPPEIKAGLQKLKPTVTGAHLAVTIDQDTFANIDLPMLQQWVADAAKQLTSGHP